MKINKILVAAAMALGFVSCSSEGELTPAIDTLKDTPLQINASVAGMKTRAGYDADWGEGENINGGEAQTD